MKDKMEIQIIPWKNSPDWIIRIIPYEHPIREDGWTPDKKLGKCKLRRFVRSENDTIL